MNDEPGSVVISEICEGSIPYLGQKTQKEEWGVKLRGALYRLENDSE